MKILRLKSLSIITFIFASMFYMMGSDVCCCPAPLTNGDFEVASIDGWTQDQGGGYTIIPCDAPDVYGCEGYFAVSQLGKNREDKGVLSHVVELPTRCKGGNLIVNAKIMAAVHWQSSQTKPGCKAANEAWLDDTIQIKATFLDDADKPLGSLASEPMDCTGYGDPHVVKPPSGKKTYSVYIPLDPPLSGEIPDGAMKVKIEVIGERVTGDTIDAGVDSVSVCIR